MTTTPKQAVQALVDAPRLVDGDDERFTGYGAFGMPFAGGHYLALRHMLASSVGPAYHAVWHRDPGGRWTIHTTTDPRLSCPRYFGEASVSERVPDISVEWRDDWTLVVTMGERLTWRMHLGADAATRAMSAMGGLTPGWAWNSRAVLGSMGPMAGGVLGSGRICLAGATPNGPRYRAAPVRVWRIVDSHAQLDGHDLGPVGPLDEQARLGDFWLPQRGLFFSGRARFTNQSGRTPSRSVAQAGS